MEDSSIIQLLKQVLATGATITLKIEGKAANEAPEPLLAECAVCGWVGNKTYTTEESRDRALRAHRCKGAPMIDLDTEDPDIQSLVNAINEWDN